MPNGIIRFSEFELDRGRYELRRGNRPLKLEKIPMDLLLFLAAAEGQLVTREQIIEHVWGKDVFVDTEHGINTAVRKIRQALKDDPDQPRFVQTVTGRGYRFIAPVTVEPEPPSNGDRPTDPAAREVAAAAHGATQRTVPAGRIAAWLTVVIAIAVVLVGVNFQGWRDRIWRHPAKPIIRSLAVLPLENLSGDPAQDYFADGMTDELITMLAKNSGLRVISRTSVMQYKKAQRPIGDIARELGVDGILEGSVERSGNRVHLNAQLIYAPQDRHLWAQSYDRDLSDVASLQGDLARRIAREVGQTAAPGIQQEQRINGEAHDAYLLGRYNWFSANGKAARKYFEKAISLQPDYAAAWGGLADSYIGSAVEGIERPADVMPQGEAAARKAVELDDSLPEAHSSLAAAYFFYRWNLERADHESARALELNPQYAEGHHGRSYVLLALNRPAEAVEEQKKATELDPFYRPWALAFVLTQARQFDAAVDEARLRIAAQPDNASLHEVLSSAYWHKGMETEAAREWEISLQLADRSQDALAVHQAFERGGLKGVFEWQLSELNRKAAEGYVSSFDFANTYACLRRKEETLGALEKAYENHDPFMIRIQTFSNFDFVHSEPRYQSIIKKVGLPPPPDAPDQKSQ